MAKEVKDRINCYVKGEIKQYIDEQCDFYGMSIGAFISMVVMQHKMQSEVTSSLSELQKLLSEVKAIEVSKES